MRSIGWKLRSKDRQLDLSLGGRWYLIFTLLLGIAAIYSGNNVIYLLESLFLSSLLLSGVLSELTVSRIRVSRAIGNMQAGVFGEDVFVVENLGHLPLYCLEFGEWRNAECEFTGFLLVLPGKAKVRVRSRQKVAQRGRHYWDGIVAATSFPFGFAKKIRIIKSPGSRIVWPKGVAPKKGEERLTASQRGELEVVSGEVVQVEPWEDVSRVHWPISQRVGALMARPLRWLEPREEVWLELCVPGEELERRIGKAAGALHTKADTLVLITGGERKRIEGSWPALDTLALLPKEESA